MKSRHRKFKNSLNAGAFTLIEIMVVVVILGILSTAVILSVSGNTDTARENVLKSDLITLRKALELYKLHINSYPEKLDYLVSRPPSDESEKWKGPYIIGELPKDPWGNDYVYKITSDSEIGYILESEGPEEKNHKRKGDSDEAKKD
jgi:general secretion pathway protein G